MRGGGRIAINLKGAVGAKGTKKKSNINKYNYS